MFSKPQMFKLFSHSQRNSSINTLCHFLCNPLCTMTEPGNITASPEPAESPDLPRWLKFSETQNPETPNSDDDFVIPSVASWVESHKLDKFSRVVKHLISESTDNDVDKISKILTNRYESPDHVAQALNGCGVNLSNSLVEQVLKRFSNDMVPAFGFFVWAKSQTGYEHSPDTYNSMIDVLGKRKKFDLIWDLVEEMNQLEGFVTLVTMGKVMRRLARAGRYSDAIEAFRGMERFCVRKDALALSILMDAMAKEGSVEHAHEVFGEFKDLIPLDSHCFNVLIHGWCKARNLDNARKVMEEMEKQGFKPDVISYTCFIEAYSHDKDFRKVDEILNEMEEKGCKPNAITYTIAMHTLGKAKQISEALNVYEKMKRNNCLPDASFYSSLIYILSKAGRLKDAREVFEDMAKQGVNPDTLTYNTMIASACEHSQEEAALKLLQKMEEDSCKPDYKTYAPLLKMCCRKKWMKVLQFLLDHMFKNDISLEAGTYSLLVRGLCKSGKLEHACLFFEEMVLKGLNPKDSIYKMLIEKLEGKGMRKAKEQIEKLMSPVKEQDTAMG